MKNFLDLTAIDTSKKLEVLIELTLHNNPNYIFTVNSLPVVQTQATLYFDLLDNLKFQCNVIEGAVEIKNIQINDQIIMPLYLAQADPKTSWITNIWTLEIKEPFYAWIHKITGQGWIA